MSKSTERLKRAAVSGMLFRFSERILAQLVSMVVTIVLARILLPKDYGIVSLVSILITICNVFITHGLSSALIQKKDADQLDYSTIFYAGLVLSVILFWLIFFASPFVAKFYNNKLITPVLRIMGLKIPISAVNSVQSAYVSKNYLFKKFFFATLIGTVTSGVVGVVMALYGFGVWALVAQYLINSAMDTFFLWITVKWRPTLQFSFSRFKRLFGFGWKVLISGLIAEVYDEIRSLIIGKYYSTSDLSYFTKGKQFPQLIGNNISATISNVMFPVFSECQDDVQLLKNATRRTIKVSSYILCPLLIGFAVIAESFVKLLLTDKWLPAVPYLQIFAIMYLFKPLKNINKSSMKALRRSDLDLIGNIIEKVIGVGLVFVFIDDGPKYLAWSALFTYAVALIVNGTLNGRLIHYNIKEQFSDALPYAFLAVVSCVPSWFIGRLSINLALKLFIQIIVAVIIYVTLSLLFRIKVFKYLVDTVKRMLSPYLKKKKAE